MTRRVVAILVAVGALLAGAPAARAQKLEVYTKPVKPFAFEEDGKAKGFSIDLWERVAKEAGLTFEIHWVKTVPELIEALKAGKADVAIAAISITSEREAVVDFSTPYYESGLGVLVTAHGQSATSVMLSAIGSMSFLKMCALLVLMLFLTANLIWWFERHANHEQFPKTYKHGVWEASWWAISTILSGGCEGKGPMAVGGRVISALWMLVCIVVVTYLTAAITTIMTVNQLTSDINGAMDLPGQKVATAKGTTAEKYLRDHGAKVATYDTIDGAFDALDHGEVSAVVYDEPILLYHVKEGAARGQKVVGRLFERQNYGIGLQENSPYRKPINGALLKLREDGTLDELNAKWFGE